MPEYPFKLKTRSAIVSMYCAVTASIFRNFKSLFRVFIDTHDMVLAMQECQYSCGWTFLHDMQEPFSSLPTRALRPTAVACKSARGLTFQTCLPITSGSQNQLRLLASVTDNAWATCTCSAKRLPESAMGSALRIKSSQILVRIGPAQNDASLGVEHCKS